jgi:acetoin utilization deacetylase AcuC-like enzyme
LYLKHLCECGGTAAEVAITRKTFSDILNSTHLALEAARTQSFALTRPPGHHAGIKSFEGFCFINNIAVATNYLVSQGERVFIIDFDVHHGNGTQEIFYENDQVYFASIHQKDIYPNSGDVDEIGLNNGQGFTKNIPLNQGATDVEFLEAMDDIIKLIKKFNPDIIAISAGFDGLTEDNIGGLSLTVDSYAQTGKRLSALNIPTFAVLEGGYHYKLNECIRTFVEEFNQ